MTIIHAQLIGDQAVLPRTELERLVELAQKSDKVDLQLHEDESSPKVLMRLAEQGGAFDFWKNQDEEIYSNQDGEPL